MAERRNIVQLVLQLKDELTKSADRMRGNTGKLQRKLGALGRDAKQAGLAILAAGTAFAVAAKKAIDFADNIGKTADKLGIGVEALQEFRFAAEQAGVATNVTDLALQRFIRRAAEAAQGTGAAKDALKELGVTLLDDAGNLRNTDDLLGQVADGLRDTKTDADRLRLAMRLFDSEGVAFINLLRDGSEALNRQRQAARDLGVVLGEDLVRQAEKAQDRINILTTVLKIKFVTAMLAAVKGVEKFIQAWKFFFTNKIPIEDFTDNLDSMKEKVDAITDRIGFLTKAHQSYFGAINPMVLKQIQDLEQQRDVLKNMIELLEKSRKGVKTLATEQKKVLSELEKECLKANKVQQTCLEKAAEAKKKLAEKTRNEIADAELKRDEEIFRHEEEILKARNRALDLDDERRQRIKDKADRREIEATRKVAAIVKKIKRDALEDTRRKTEQLHRVFDRMFDGGIRGGNQFSGVVRGITSDLVRLAAQAILIEPLLGSISSSQKKSGGSPFARGATSFLGSLFGFQQGGIVPGPVGKPRMAIVHGGEDITPAGKSSSQVIINVINNTSSKVETSSREGPGARREISLFIEEEVRSDISGGKFDRAFGQSFGLSRQGAQR